MKRRICWQGQDNVLTLLGNHELLLYDTYIHNASAVYQSLTEVKEMLSEQEQKAVMQWIEDMPECKLITVNGRKFYLNHTQAASEDYFRQELTDRMFPEYSIYKNYSNLTIKDIICIHGHIPTMQIRMWNNQGNDSTIWKNKNESIIDIDCGAGYPKEGGKLGCLRLNDMKEYIVQVVVQQVIGLQHHHLRKHIVHMATDILFFELMYSVHGKNINAIYKGVKGKKTDKSEWKIVSNTHEPIISREVFMKVQNMLEVLNKKYCDDRNNGAYREKNIFAGKLKCADCGKGLQLRYEKGRWFYR